MVELCCDAKPVFGALCSFAAEESFDLVDIVRSVS